MAKKAAASRFERLPGTERYFVDTRTGDIVSRYRRDKLVKGVSKTTRKVATSFDLRPYVPRGEQAKKQFAALVQDRVNWLNTDLKKGQPRYTYDEVAASPEMRQIIHDLKLKSNKARGYKARALVQLGRRSPDWTSDVGESPEAVAPIVMRSKRRSRRMGERETRTGRL